MSAIQISPSEIEILKGLPLPDFFRMHALDVLEGRAGPDDLRDRYEAGGADPGAVTFVIDRLRRTSLSLGAAEPSTVLEIGAGTGSYLRELQRHWPNATIEIYEIEPFWQAYNTFSTGCHALKTTGTDLSLTPDASVYFIHAHGVFIYLKPLEFCSYIRGGPRLCGEKPHRLRFHQLRQF